MNEPFITKEEDRRSEDQDKAVEDAFVEGTLPEADRRADADTETVAVVEAPVAATPVSKPARGDKRKG